MMMIMTMTMAAAVSSEIVSPVAHSLCSGAGKKRREKCQVLQARASDSVSKVA
jgi:hypothetical protein